MNLFQSTSSIRTDLPKAIYDGNYLISSIAKLNQEKIDGWQKKLKDFSQKPRILENRIGNSMMEKLLEYLASVQWTSKRKKK